MFGQLTHKIVILLTSYLSLEGFKNGITVSAKRCNPIINMLTTVFLSCECK